MAREVYRMVKSAVVEANPYFVERADTIGRKGISTDTKLIIALRQLADGDAYDSVAKEYEVHSSCVHPGRHAANTTRTRAAPCALAPLRSLPVNE